jgi:hypothetical protein
MAVLQFRETLRYWQSQGSDLDSFGVNLREFFKPFTDVVGSRTPRRRG